MHLIFLPPTDESGREASEGGSGQKRLAKVTFMPRINPPHLGEEEGDRLRLLTERGGETDKRKEEDDIRRKSVSKLCASGTTLGKETLGRSRISHI